MNRHFATAAAVAMLALAGAARAAEVIDFEAGPFGSQGQGFTAVGHPDLQFFSANGNGLEVGNFGNRGAGESLAVFSDADGNFLVGKFSGTTTALSLDFGNDAPGFTLNGDRATLRTFLGVNFVGQSTVPLNRDGIMNQTILFVGGPFDNFTFAYTDANGAPFTGGGDRNTGLTEIVDNITFNPVVRAVGGAAPEPASWALMILGFGTVGAMMRRRKPALAI